MAESNFAIDDRSFIEELTHNENGTKAQAEFSKYLTFMESISNTIASEKYGDIYTPESIFQEKINGKEIYKILGSRAGANRDVYLRAFTLFRRSKTYVTEDHLDLGVYACDNEYASSSFIQNRNCGFISIRNVEIAEWWDKSRHTLVNNKLSALCSYRKNIYNNNQSYADVKTYSEKLWPNCYFHRTAARFNQFQIPEIAFLPIALRHLDYLNDYTQSHFPLGGEQFTAEANKFDVSLSPESPKTRSSTSKMNQRKIKINSKDITCEWHSKLDHSAGRIHFHSGLNLRSDIMGLTKDKVIIGKFVKHLDT